MSVRTLARAVLPGTPPGTRRASKHPAGVRIEAAKRALESGERVSAVAGVVGYADPAAFRRTFARLTGLTPADYRARYGPASAPVTTVPGGVVGGGRKTAAP